MLAFHVKNSLTLLMLQASSFIGEDGGGWLVTAWIEGEAKVVEGEPDHDILMFFLQPRQGEASSSSLSLIS